MRANWVIAALPSLELLVQGGHPHGQIVAFIKLHAMGTLSPLVTCWNSAGSSYAAGESHASRFQNPTRLSEKPWVLMLLS